MSEKQSIATAQPDWIQSLRVPGYEDLELLGHGAVGWVFKARQVSLKRPVALKILDPELAKDQDQVERFHREARSAARLRHPNIVALYDVGTVPGAGLHYIVLEHVQGTTLEEVLGRAGTLPEDEALEVCRGVAAALVCAEDHRIVHRDIKPENILLTDDGVPKLVDLGLAKQRADAAGLTVAGALLGSPHYVSPEQGLGLPDIDTRADLYALGVTLYRLLTGAFPFEGSSFVELVDRHANEDVPDPRLRDDRISEAASRLVAGLCARERDDRYQSAEAAVHDLDRALAGKPPLGPAGAAAALAGDVPTEPRGAAPPAPEPSDGDGGEPFDVLVELDGVPLTRHRFARDVIVVGRSAGVDVQVDNPIVSRRHAEIRRLPDGSFSVAPLSTTNSTSLNGRRVLEPTPLRQGDALILSDKFRLSVVAADPGAAAPPTEEEADEDTAVIVRRAASPPTSPEPLPTRRVARPGTTDEAPTPPSSDRPPPADPEAAAIVASDDEPAAPSPYSSADLLADEPPTPPAAPRPPEPVSPPQPTPPAGEDAMPWPDPRGFLSYRRGGQEVRSFVPRGFQIGRSPTCDVRLRGATAPRKAALIVRCQDGYRLYNIGPDAEAVVLNGEPVSDQAVLQDGDVIEVLDLQLRFAEDPDPPG